MQCIVTQLDLALLSGRSWLSPILRLLGPAAEQPGTAVGICAAACAHRLCIPLPGCGSSVKGMAGPSWPCHSLSPPRAVGGLGNPPLPRPLLPKSRKTNERQPRCKPRGFVLPGLSASLASWLLFSCALLQSGMLAWEPRASPCHRAWYLGFTPRSSTPSARGCWVMGDCRESRALL